MFNNNIFESLNTAKQKVIFALVIPLAILSVLSLVGMTLGYNMNFDWQIGKSFHMEFTPNEIHNTYNKNESSSKNDKISINNNNAIITL